MPRVKNIDKIKFIAKLEIKVKQIEDQLPQISSRSRLDSIIEELTNDISNSAMSSKLASNKISKSKLDFWSEELLQLKLKLRNAKGKAYKTKNKSDVNNHKQLKAEYQRLLWRSKKEAFEKQCTVKMNENPYKGLKKIAASQSSNVLPGELILNLWDYPRDDRDGKVPWNIFFRLICSYENFCASFVEIHWLGY